MAALADYDEGMDAAHWAMKREHIIGEYKANISTTDLFEEHRMMRRPASPGLFPRIIKPGCVVHVDKMDC
jgi:hypothetical protein